MTLIRTRYLFLSLPLSSVAAQADLQPDNSVEFSTITAYNDHVTKYTIYEVHQPHIKITGGCKQYPPFDHLATRAWVHPQSGAGVDCSNPLHGANTYARAWSSLDGAFALLYSHFFPVGPDGVNKHAYYWTHYVTFFRHKNNLNPFACLLWDSFVTGWRKFSGADCQHSEYGYPQTVIEVGLNGMSFSSVTPQLDDRAKLVVWEFMYPNFTKVFDEIDWIHQRTVKLDMLPLSCFITPILGACRAFPVSLDFCVGNCSGNVCTSC